MPTLIQNIVFVIFQLLSKFFMVFIDLVMQPKIERPQNLRVPQGTLIISNHQSALDPWLVSNYIDFRDILAMLPIRYPVTPKFIRRPFIGQLIWCFGGYDIGLTTLERGKKLLYTRDLIHNKYTVLLFPEGKIHDQNIGEFHRGMNILLQENIPILLVRIRGMNAKSTFRGVSLKYSDLIKNQPFEEKMRLTEEFFRSN